MPAILTQHAVERCKLRGGWKPAAAQRMADRALEEGMTHSQTHGALKRYLDGLYLAERNANNLRIYGRHVFLFYDHTLITVLHLDHEFAHAVDKHQQRSSNV